MRIRPVHTWWLGVALFTPSILIWALMLGVSISRGTFHCPFDSQGIKSIYLPLFGALAGFSVPLACLRLLRSGSWRLTSWAFTGYLAVLLTWAVSDVRQEHYQMRGEDYLQGKSWHDGVHLPEGSSPVCAKASGQDTTGI
jgi:hypothetical protein